MGELVAVGVHALVCMEYTNVTTLHGQQANTPPWSTGVAQLQALHTQCAALKEQVQLLQQQWEDAQAAATQAKEQLAVLKAQHTGLQHKYKV